MRHEHATPRDSVRSLIFIAALALAGCATSSQRSRPTDPEAACVYYAKELLAGAVVELENSRRPITRSAIAADHSVILFGLDRKGCRPARHYLDLVTAQSPASP